MTFETFSKTVLPVVDRTMLEILEEAREAGTTGLRAEADPLHEMMAYHLGLDAGAGAGLNQGKRIRPLLVLLTGAACSGSADGWREALPAAAAVELLHNFSLIHDDIQDNSETRRGRPSVWVKWGVPQAINAGDAMYTLAYRALSGLRARSGPETALEAFYILQRTALALTRGQYLDLAFETRSAVRPDEYWSMIEGKTAALLAACTELGALSAGVSGERRAAFREFGRCLGLAFQAQDDLLGIWGDQARTGKSTASDMVAGKKSLPILYGLAADGEFAKRWQAGPIRPEDAAGAADLLEREGGLRYTQEQVQARTAEAMHALETAAPEGEPGAWLAGLADSLIRRQG